MKKLVSRIRKNWKTQIIAAFMNPSYRGIGLTTATRAKTNLPRSPSYTAWFCGYYKGGFCAIFDKDPFR
jgi:hypothetical protein